MADEFSEKLNAILGNPEAMGQIMSLARALGGESGGPSAPPPQQEAPEPAAPPPSPPALPTPDPAPGEGPDLSVLLGTLKALMGGGSGEAAQAGSTGDAGSLLGDLDPRLIQTGMRLLTEYNRTDDRKTALLLALRPFVKEERYAKVDRAVQIAKLSRIIRIALQVFRESGGGDGDV